MEEAREGRERVSEAHSDAEPSSTLSLGNFLFPCVCMGNNARVGRREEEKAEKPPVRARWQPGESMSHSMEKRPKAGVSRAAQTWRKNNTKSGSRQPMYDLVT